MRGGLHFRRLPRIQSGWTVCFPPLLACGAGGRALTARLEVLSANRLAVSVANAHATYPVRIDPTFSDADRVSMGSGMNGAVYALAVSGTNLYMAGQFDLAGGQHIAN